MEGFIYDLEVRSSECTLFIYFRVHLLTIATPLSGLKKVLGVPSESHFALHLYWNFLESPLRSFVPKGVESQMLLDSNKAYPVPENIVIHA